MCMIFLHRNVSPHFCPQHAWSSPMSIGLSVLRAPCATKRGTNQSLQRHQHHQHSPAVSPWAGCRTPKHQLKTLGCCSQASVQRGEGFWKSLLLLASISPKNHRGLMAPIMSHDYSHNSWVDTSNWVASIHHLQTIFCRWFYRLNANDSLGATNLPATWDGSMLLATIRTILFVKCMVFLLSSVGWNNYRLASLTAGSMVDTLW